MTNCAHAHATIIRTSGYSGPVAVHPYTTEDRRAHGGVEHTERCDSCGAVRRRLDNQGWTELGVWGTAERYAGPPVPVMPPAYQEPDAHRRAREGLIARRSMGRR